LFAIHGRADAFPALAMRLEVPVFQFQPGPIGRLDDEAYFPFAGLLGIGFDLPAWADVPAKEKTMGWFESQDARPTAFTAVESSVLLKGHAHQMLNVGPFAEDCRFGS
jgi:hypothetical protein